MRDAARRVQLRSSGGDNRMQSKAETTPKATRVLVVEDNEWIAFALREYVASLGYPVTAVDTLSAALERLEATPFGVVVADYRLTGTDSTEGLELINIVRERYPNT